MADLPLNEFCDLFSLYIRGELASAFMRRGVTPTEDEWKMLGGVREMTTRDIGNMAFRLDCQAIFELVANPEEPAHG